MTCSYRIPPDVGTYLSIHFALPISHEDVPHPGEVHFQPKLCYTPHLQNDTESPSAPKLHTGKHYFVGNLEDYHSLNIFVCMIPMMYAENHYILFLCILILCYMSSLILGQRAHNIHVFL